MTNIEMITNDQQLIVSQKVKLASGDINSVRLCVTFDSAWDDYSARTATFYTSKDSTVYEMLMTNNKCIVPSEVLAEAATLFIAVRGATVDGTAIKTSSEVSYKIVKGATSGYTTLTPTLDLYQQYLAAMAELVSPYTDDLNKKIAAHETAIEELLNNKIEEIETAFETLTPVTLWTNPDTTADFAAQTINLDLNNYKRFVVRYKATTNDDYFKEDTLSAKNVQYVMNIWDLDGYTAYRTVTFTNTSIAFGYGKKGSGLSANDECIPCEVIGYKY